LQRLENSFAELKRFTADASHELRTPLTALRTVGEVAVRADRNPGALRETILSMLEEAQRLDELIESLLALARLESGEGSLRQENVDVGELIQEVRETLSILALERRQTIQLRDGHGTSVRADKVLLRQALLNIVHNAIRNSPEAATITIGSDCTKCEVVIAVTDESGDRA
jgi:signal transduction histidine kinase